MFYIIIVFILIILISIKQINQYERGVRFSFGKFSGIIQPGWRIVLPIVQSYKKSISVQRQSMFLIKMRLRGTMYLFV